MPRYIDADELYKKLYPLDLADKRKYTINAKAVADAIANIPTADVVPKSEVERWRRNLEAVLEEIPETKREVAREIFAEIARISCRISECDGNGNIRILCYQLSSEKLAELKKKYIEQ